MGWGSASIQGWIASRVSQTSREVKCWTCTPIFVICAFTLKNISPRYADLPLTLLALLAAVVFNVEAFLERSQVSLFQIEVRACDHFPAFLSRNPINNLRSVCP